jgi:hypothetical protein
MNLPDDLKQYGGAKLGAFQLVSEETAGAIFGVLAALLFLTDLCDRLGLTHIWR